MKRVITSTVATIAGLVMLLGFKTHTAAPVAATATSTNEQPTASSSSSSQSASSSSSSGSRTVTGNAADTRWGPVQVQLTLDGSKITDVNVVEYPQNNGRDVEINQYAVPELVSETLKAQSAKVATISGATYTSEGFIKSLESALDKA
jgi:uncharacterized protein with FMN-binding domain